MEDVNKKAELPFPKLVRGLGRDWMVGLFWNDNEEVVLEKIEDEALLVVIILMH